MSSKNSFFRFAIMLIFVSTACSDTTSGNTNNANNANNVNNVNNVNNINNLNNVADGGQDTGQDMTEDLGPKATFCAGTGPLLIPGSGGEGRCSGSVAEDVFKFALCSCSDLTSTIGVKTDSYDSTINTTPVAGGGAVGVNGSMTSNTGSTIGGSLWVSGDVSSTSATSVANDLHVGGEVTSSITIGGDAYVKGGAQNGAMTIEGVLTLPASAPEGNSTYTSLTRAPVEVAPQCRCEENTIPDIEGIISAHATENDNADIGLSPDDLSNDLGELTLPCGQYYLTRIERTDAVMIHVEGRVALFIDGAIELTTGLDVDFTTPDAELDIFVRDGVRSTGGIRLGAPENASKSRLYIAGTEVIFTAQSTIVGNIYAPRATVRTTGGIELYGSLVAGSFTSTFLSTFHYDQDILRAGDDCSTPDSCTSCGQCDSSDACIGGECTSCQTDSDCCAPLTCIQGACTPYFL